MNNNSFQQELGTEAEARYLTAITESQAELEDKLLLLLEDLEASFDDIRENPLEKRMELEATVNSNFEYWLLIHWSTAYTSPLLLTFDIRMFTPIEPYHLERALAEPIAIHFQPPALVYNSYGRNRILEVFPRLIDFENIIRELIITVMFTKFGPEWETQIVNEEGIKQIYEGAIENRNTESKGKIHNSMLMHWLYYTQLKDLRTIMENVDKIARANVQATMADPSTLTSSKRKKWEHDLAVQLPFAGIFYNYDQINILERISEMREPRNRVMHGRYLTEENANLINSICDLFDRFIVKPGHVGQFKSRILAP